MESAINLTVTMGLRYEPQGVMKEIFGRTEQFWPSAYAAGVHSKIIPTAPAGLFFLGDCYNGGCMPATGEHGDYENWAPRLGFAYNVFSKTVIRAGAGIFYSTRLPGLFLNDATISQPFSLRTDITEPGNTPNSLIPFANPLQSNPAFAAAFPERYVLSTVPQNVTFHWARFGVWPRAIARLGDAHHLRLELHYRESECGRTPSSAPRMSACARCTFVRTSI